MSTEITPQQVFTNLVLESQVNLTKLIAMQQEIMFYIRKMFIQDSNNVEPSIQQGQQRNEEQLLKQGQSIQLDNTSEPINSDPIPTQNTTI